MYDAMIKHWQENGPPVGVSVAGYLGLIKPKRSGTKGKGQLGDLDDLINAFPGGMIQ